jgi:Zn-dependent M16 (insulinase) family peptidase
LALYLKKPYVAVKAKPSKNLGDKLAKEEKDRIRKQVEKLGKDNLQKLGEKLKADIASNELPIPPAILQHVNLPDVTKLPFYHVSTFRTTEDSSTSNSTLGPRILKGQNGAELPFEIEFDQIPSAFVKVSVVVDTENLADHLRPYLEVWRNLIFEVPILRDGVLVDHEDIVRAIEQETVDTSCSVGFGEESPFKTGPFSQLSWISIRAEAKRYERTVQWIKDFLYNTRFTAERLKVGVKRLLKDVSDVKRSGSTVSTVLFSSFLPPRFLTHLILSRWYKSFYRIWY